MSRRSIVSIVFVFAVLIMVAGVTVLGRRTKKLPVRWQTPPFALLDQNGDTLHSAELRGSVWVAHFFFTHCTSICPLTTSKMARLRDHLADEGLLGTDVRLVSISVDPARDTPAVLHAWAAQYGGSPPRDWAFLTGSPADSIWRLLQQGFKVTAMAPHPVPSDTDYQVQHSPRLELVDRNGRVRGTYDATDPRTVQHVLDDIHALRP